MTSLPLYLNASLRHIETRHAADSLMQRGGIGGCRMGCPAGREMNRPILVLAGPQQWRRCLRNGPPAARAIFRCLPGFCRRGQQTAARCRSCLPRFHCRWRAPFLPASAEDTQWSLIVDGLFGIGLARAPEGLYAQWIASANRLAERDCCPLLALDCPSGLNPETGASLLPTIRASHTLSFIAAKPGLYMADGPDHCGEVRIADLALDSVAECAPDGWLLSRDDFAERLKPRRRNTHKGSFGNAGVLGGAKSMVGAAFLAGRAALKLGAGRVYVGLLDGEAPAVDLQQPELMLRRADVLLQTDLQALACGPGLGRSSEALRLLEQSLKAPVQLVLDADALNLLADDGRLEGNLTNRVGPAILTPHPAEAARLLGCSVRDIQNDRVRAAVELADRYRSHIALKGCGTVIALTDGRWWINNTGNPGMATAGMGDVLCGLIIALLAQNWPPEMALLAAVHLHGAAADRLVACGNGPVGLTAGEVIDPARCLFNSWVSGKVAL